MLDFVNIKNTCASKDTIKKVKQQPRRQEKISANHISDKESLEEETQIMTDKHLRGCPTPLATKKTN